MHYDFILTNYVCKDPHVQIRWHSEVLGGHGLLEDTIRTSTEFLRLLRLHHSPSPRIVSSFPSGGPAVALSPGFVWVCQSPDVLPLSRPALTHSGDLKLTTPSHLTVWSASLYGMQRLSFAKRNVTPLRSRTLTKPLLPTQQLGPPSQSTVFRDPCTASPLSPANRSSFIQSQEVTPCFTEKIKPRTFKSVKNLLPLHFTYIYSKSHGRRSLVGSMGSLGVRHNWSTSLSLFTFCIGEGNDNPLQCSCLENPRDRGAWWATVHGVPEGQTWLSD